MYRRIAAFSLLTVAAVAAPGTRAAAQFGPPATGFVVENPILRRMYALGMDSSHAEALAQVLFDSLGPRLTGSPGMEAAQDWAVNTYKSWGLTDARKEQYGTWRGWRRGITHIDLVAPRVRSLEGTMLAWSPGTPKGKVVRAPVVAIPDVADSAARCIPGAIACSRVSASASRSPRLPVANACTSSTTTRFSPANSAKLSG